MKRTNSHLHVDEPMNLRSVHSDEIPYLSALPVYNSKPDRFQRISDWQIGFGCGSSNITVTLSHRRADRSYRHSSMERLLGDTSTILLPFALIHFFFLHLLPSIQLFLPTVSFLHSGLNIFKLFMSKTFRMEEAVFDLIEKAKEITLLGYVCILCAVVALECLIMIWCRVCSESRVRKTSK